jgi:geranylgeranyl diphosphate synthase, type II
MTKISYTDLNASFDEYFSDVISEFPKKPENLYQPVNYFLNLGGKRVRPLLTLIAADCFNSDVKKVMPAAAAVELFHNFSLIHDDIMDNAPLRRGKQTVHEKWNSNIGILSGDVLLVKAYLQLNKCNRSVAVELQEIFSQTAREVCEGQQYDMDFESRGDVTIAEYLEMIKLKTAVLLACCLKMGAICGAASEKSIELFYNAGKDLGIAFQLTDDYLDVFGDSAKVGKQVGGDIISNKKTWLLIKALELANAKQKIELQSWLSKKEFNAEEKVKAVKTIFSELKLDEVLKAEIDSYYIKAFVDLRTACKNEEKIEAFISFIKTLMNRDK